MVEVEFSAFGMQQLLTQTENLFQLKLNIKKAFWTYAQNAFCTV
jgi:hypothetical protein